MQTQLFESLSSARKILESLKIKLSPLTLLSSRPQNDENQSYLANQAIAPAIVKPSDNMEIHWLKSAIDRLCHDNALLYQDINEILRLFEALGLRYKQLRDHSCEKLRQKASQETRLLGQKLEAEQVKSIGFLIKKP